jgi:phage baseplate assembly protein W
MAEAVQFDFPYQFDARGRTASTSEEDHIRDLIEQLIFTSPGERVNRPEFGSGILQLIFAPNSPELAATLQFTLQAAIQRYLSDLVDLRSLNVSAVDSALTIEMKYLIRRTHQEQTAAFTRSV